MSINRVVLSGFFSYPYGDAAGSRIRNLSLGFKTHLPDVHVISSYFDDNSLVFKPEGEFSTGPIKVTYNSIIPYQKLNPSGSLIERLKFRYELYNASSNLISTTLNSLRGDDQELLFLYGRSYIFLRSLLKKLKKLNYQTKVVFDIVEPPRNEANVLEYLYHPFVLDSVLIFKKLLQKFDACTFITHQLEKEFGPRVNKGIVVPSVLYTTTVPEFKQQNTSFLKIGYLGAFYEKDYPQLIYKLCEQLHIDKCPFELSIIGRYRYCEEGRRWENIFLSSPFKSSLKFYDNPDESNKEKILNDLDYITLFRKPERVQLYTFPTRIAEVLTLGKVVLVNDFGDFSKYFVNGDNAVFVSEDTIEEDCNNLKDTLHPSIYEALAVKGFKLLRTSFDSIAQSARILGMFAK